IYFIGVSYGAAMLAAILYYFKVPWGRPIIRISALVAFITGIIGPVFILLCIGRFDRLHYLFIHARVQSPITWDVMVISTYLVGITVFAYLLLVKDFAILRDSPLLELPSWRRKLYSALALRYKGTEEQENQIDHSTKSMAFIMVPKVILAFAVLSWIFGMSLRPGWHSTIFGPAYVISSVATGIALIIGVMWVYRKLFGLDEYLTDQHFRKMALILLVLVAAFGYFTFSEYITSWYSSGKWEAAVTAKLLDFDEFGWAFHLANLFGIIIPIIVIAFPRLRTPNNLALISLLLVVAVWVRRYLTVVPPLETPLLPVQDARPEFLHYSATWVEWALVLAGAATFFIFFTLIPKLINVIPISVYEKENK
ncbi:MAG: polysulfide reductase NrfD, partial [Phaeodactylibacter sp.]|nr:polysulfide reductase NrfD [Phaeodactylibacter sp.]